MRDSGMPNKGKVIEEVRNMLMNARRDPAFARTFIETICLHERPWERPHRAACSGSEGYRWEYPYRNRIIHSLAEYLGLDEKKRKLIHAGAEDGVKWGGEPPDLFVSVVSETLTMREVGVEGYRKQVFDKMRNLGKKIVRGDRHE